MPRKPRYDSPNQLHHVLNRGQNKQVIFSSERDYRRFQSLLACSVRRGELRVHTYSLMANHYHLLVSSPSGNVWYAMMRILSVYARLRNLPRGEEGSPFPSRFKSIPVNSLAYLLVLVRYIDFNPVKAGICQHPSEYPFGGAIRHMQGRRTPWLAANLVRMLLDRFTSPASTQRARYDTVFGSRLSEPELEFLERRVSSPRIAEDLHAELMAAPPPHIAKWLAEKSALGSGKTLWAPMASGRTVSLAVHELSTTLGAWRLPPPHARTCGWRVAEAVLLTKLAGYRQGEVARSLGCSSSTVRRLLAMEPKCRAELGLFDERVGLVGRRAIEMTFGAIARLADQEIPDH